MSENYPLEEVLADPNYPQDWDDTSTVMIIPHWMLMDDPWQARSESDPATVQELTEDFTFRGDEGEEREFESVSDEELLDCLKDPLLIRRGSKGEIIILGGSQRREAQGYAGWDRTPCRIARIENNEAAVIEHQLSHNQKRKNLQSANLGDNYQRLIELHDFSSIQELADHLGKSRTEIGKCHMLHRLPEPVKAQINIGRIVHASGILLARLLRYSGDADLVAEVGDKVASGTMKAKALKAFVAKWKAKYELKKEAAFLVEVQDDDEESHDDEESDEDDEESHDGEESDEDDEESHDDEESDEDDEESHDGEESDEDDEESHDGEESDEDDEESHDDEESDEDDEESHDGEESDEDDEESHDDESDSGRFEESNSIIDQARRARKEGGGVLEDEVETTVFDDPTSLFAHKDESAPSKTEAAFEVHVYKAGGGYHFMVLVEGDAAEDEGSIVIEALELAIVKARAKYQ